MAIQGLRHLISGIAGMAMMVLASCGGERESQHPAIATDATATGRAQSSTVAPVRVPAPPTIRGQELEVFVDSLPTKPYVAIGSFRYPAPGSAGEEMGYIKERARREGGDAVLVRVYSGSIGRTDIDDESLIEATVIAWR